MHIGLVRSARVASLAVACLLVTPALPAHASTQSRPAVAPSHPATSSPTTPGFEENRGQFDPRVRFVRRGSDAMLFLTRDGAVTTLATGGVVRARFVGASPSANVEGTDRLAGNVSSLHGDDPSRWVAGAARYASVRYRDLYPGIDVVVYEGPALEYDVVVAPGADLAQFALGLDDASRPSIDADGSLVLRASGGDVVHRVPVGYQIVGGARRAVACRFALDGSTAHLVAGRHDPSLPLVVDPLLSVSTYYGGDNVDRANAIALDTAGNIYLTGRTFSADFPTVQPVDASINGNYDVFVTKLAPNAASVVYSTFVGGGDFESGQGIAVSSTGEATVTGYTGSTDFPMVNAFQANLSAGIDAIVFRLNAAGSALSLSSYLGGGGTDEGHGVAVSAAGDAYVVGETGSTNLATTVGAVQTTYGGGMHDAFYAKISANALTTLSYLGGLNDDIGNGIALDTGANVYLTGQAGATFPLVTPFQSSVGGIDAFVTKVNASLASLTYSSYLGGANTDIGTGIAVDPSGNAYVTGYTLSTNFPVLTPFQANNGGNNDGFVAKVNAAGSAKVYASYVGGSGDDRANAIAVDQYGSAYVVGQTRSTNFPTLFPIQPTNGGNLLNDVFVTKVGASGRIRIYSTYLGGSTTDVGSGVAVDASTTAFVAGYSNSANYPLVAPVQGGNDGVDDGVLSSVVEAGDTPGVVLPSTQSWFLRNSNSPGSADYVFNYGGSSSLVPLSGDWDGNGTDTPGLYDPSTGTFFLRNSNTPGAANLVFSFGVPALFTPITGDWNGDGIDTIGLYNPTTGIFFLRNTNSNGPADLSFGYGAPGGGFTPLSGDWNGDGVDTIGLYDGSTGAWFLRDANSAGPATYVFTFGAGSVMNNPVAIAGDWNADGIDTPGLYDTVNGTWFLRNALAPGSADVVYGYGPSGAGGVPVVGDWNG